MKQLIFKHDEPIPHTVYSFSYSDNLHIQISEDQGRLFKIHKGGGLTLDTFLIKDNDLDFWYHNFGITPPKYITKRIFSCIKRMRKSS